VIDEVAKDLRLNVFSHPSTVTPAVAVGQRDLAKSLLQFVEALERVARNSPLQETSSDQGVKIA